MSDSYSLSEKEINSIIKFIDKEHRLQAYKTLKGLVLAPDITQKDLEKFKKDTIKIYKKDNLPRLLNKDELEKLVNVIPLSPSTLKDIAEDNRKQIKELIYRQLSKFRIAIDENSIAEMEKKILDKFYRSSSQAGDSVGVIASMSIGQPLTQANLNTFHETGTDTGADEGLKFVERF